MHNAFDEGGAGCVATFPRTLPLVHIDHVLIAPWLHCDDYRTIDPGVSRHLMVWARIRR
jgi:endonuclease/exonuclease/phosphatase family metal-dependent hydrolase